VTDGVASGGPVSDDAAAELPAGLPRPDPRLLAILVCPLTRMPLRYDAAAQELVNDAAGLAYPIRDGVPVMLVEEAREI
jgi:uncharacterized protein YbaR (Trm112 family)